jgi:predicted NAD/FAD-binding protein
MRIAIIGTGIAGLTTAYLLHRKHDLTLFEAGSYVGGHTNTVDIELDGRNFAIDTGFIVFNDWTYPNFIKMMEQIGVTNQPSSMGFSVRCERSGYEYNGHNVNTLFAQRRNALKPRHYLMIRDILRFNKVAKQMLADEPDNLAGMTLMDMVQRFKLGRKFIDHYLIPMGAAIWSASRETMMRFPALFFVRFFANHGFLNVGDRPTWRVIQGGSRSYIKPLTAGVADRIQVNTAIAEVRRFLDRVELHTASGESHSFDEVVFACHSDQALAMLAEPTTQEREILGALPYQPNEAILHTDESVMPKRKLAWAAWNYHILSQDQGRVAVTYNMNILQGIDYTKQFCVTLNYRDGIDPSKILRVIPYHHPIYQPEGMAAQARYDEIGGHNRSHFCGAYWFNGFHEDGVRSGLRVAAHFGEQL